MRPPEEVFSRDTSEGKRIAGGARGTLNQEPSRERMMELQKVEDEPVLKFQRMGANLGKLLSQSRESIVRMAVHDSLLAFGTSSGVVILSDYHGNEIRRMRLHSKAVTDLSMDITGDFLASCSGDGTVAVTGLQPGSGGEQTPPDMYNYGMRWPMRAVRLDPLYARRKDKVFVAGGEAGKLLLNKKRWLSNDETELHKGEGAISAIAWRGPLVAWASDVGIKIMDVEKGKAGKPISYVDKPRSLEEFRDYGCRCHLLWETPTRLLVGWGDTVMVLQILVREPRHKRTTSLSLPYHSQNPGSGSMPLQSSVPLTLTSPGGLPMGVIGTAAAAAAPVALEGPERYTQIVTVWQADCLVCGLSPFDADSIVLLGHPVDEFDDDYEDDGGMEGSVGAVVFGGEDVPASGPGQGSASPSAVFQPELQLVRRTSGEVISSDTLALKDWDSAGAGDLLLHSTCWSTSLYRQDKEGETTAFYSPSAALASTVRGLPPATFILSPRDIIVARIRDIDDKVTWSLQKGDLLGAVDVAIGHRHLLRLHDFQDLVSRYLDDLMSKGEFRLAASDCPRLLNGDSTAWERWVYGFARRRHLPAIVPYIPTKDPRLPAPVYEVVLEHLLLTEPGLFLETLRRWGHPRGKHGGQHGGRAASAGRIAPGEWAGAGTEGRIVDGHIGQEAQQELYSLPVMMARMEASLVRRPDPVIMEAQAEAYVMDRQFARAIHAYLALAEHRDDASVSRRRGKLRSSAGERKAREEEGTRRYGHVFRMIEQHSLLDTVKDRVLQLIKLDQELTGELLLRHPEKISVPSVVKQLEGRRDLQHWYLGLLFDRCPEMYGAQEFAPFHVLQVSLHAEFAPPFKPGHPPPYNSAFMRFLRGSGFVPLEAARQACEARVPPLYDEMAYIYARMGETERALTILLENVGSVPRAIEFVETHDKQLLSKLVKHSHKDEAFLSGLLDHVGVYDLDLAQLVKDIHPRTRIPGLRDKVVKIISDCRFQVRVNESCCASVKSDLLRRLRRLNQGQRRALLVEPGSRCSYIACRMPLNGPPRGFGIGDAGGFVASGYAQVSGRSGKDFELGDVDQASPGGGGGGRRRTRGGILVFPCGHKFHEFCHEVSSGAWGRGGGEGTGGGIRVCSICSKQRTARSNLVNLRLAPDKSRLPSS